MTSSVTDHLDFKPTLTNQEFDDVIFTEFYKTHKLGIRFVPETHGKSMISLKADSGDFAKWLRTQEPELPISIPESTPKIVLHGADVWLPLIYLASDTSVQLFLNMAASYLYDKARGSLKTDHPRIHMTVIYHDKKARKTKKFEFSGDSDSLKNAVKRFDINNFFSDDS